MAASVSFSDDTDALIDKAIKLSGITGQMETVGKTILSAVPSDAFPDWKARSEADSYIRKNASKDTLVETIISSVRDNLDKDYLQKVIQFYDSPLGRKIGRLQENSLDSGLLRNIREGRKTAVTLDEDRLKVIKRIIDSEDVSQTNDILVKSLVRGLLEGSAEETDSPEASEAIKSKLKAVEKNLAAEHHRMNDMALAAYALTFRSLTEKELLELAQYNESDAARWFRNATLKGLDQAVFSVSRALGSALTASRNSDQGSPASGRSGKHRSGDE
jgi:hypothetical protein